MGIEFFKDGSRVEKLSERTKARSNGIELDDVVVKMVSDNKTFTPYDRYSYADQLNAWRKTDGAGKIEVFFTKPEVKVAELTYFHQYMKVANLVSKSKTADRRRLCTLDRLLQEIQAEC